jgi:hypothetical protein
LLARWDRRSIGIRLDRLHIVERCVGGEVRSGNFNDTIEVLVI